MANKNKIECSLISHYKFVEVLHGGIVFIHTFPFIIVDNCYF